MNLSDLARPSRSTAISRRELLISLGLTTGISVVSAAIARSGMGVLGSSSQPSSSESSSSESSSSSGSSSSFPPGLRIVLIPYENHNLAAIKTGAPHLMAFAKAGALATNFTCLINGKAIHPSLPNYMQRSGGANPFPGQDCNTCMSPASSLWDLVEAKGLTIECFAEGLASTTPPYNYNVTFPSSAAKEYDTHHVWPTHYTRIMGNATRKAKIKDLSALNLGALANYTEIVPNVLHEMHSASVAQGDAWAAANFPPIIAAADLTICWFDEGKGPLYVAFYGPLAKKGAVSTTAYGNNDLLRTIEAVLGLGSLGTGDKSGKVMSDMLA